MLVIRPPLASRQRSIDSLLCFLNNLLSAAAMSFSIERLRALALRLDNEGQLLAEDANGIGVPLFLWLLVFFAGAASLLRARERIGDKFQRQALLTASAAGMAHTQIQQSSVSVACLRILPPWIGLGLLISWVLHAILHAFPVPYQDGGHCTDITDKADRMKEDDQVSLKFGNRP